MKRYLAILISLILLQSQAFGQLGFSSFAPLSISGGINKIDVSQLDRGRISVELGKGEMKGSETDVKGT